jgi:hypothetical protein
MRMQEAFTAAGSHQRGLSHIERVSRPSDPCSLTTNTHDESSTRSTLAHLPSRCLPGTHTIRTCANGSGMPLLNRPTTHCASKPVITRLPHPMLPALRDLLSFSERAEQRYIHSHMIAVTLRSAPAWGSRSSYYTHASCSNLYPVICMYTPNVLSSSIKAKTRPVNSEVHSEPNAILDVACNLPLCPPTLGFHFAR